MALPGTGYRSVLSMMLELSKHLVEPIIFTTLQSAIDFGGYGEGGYGEGGYGGGSVNPVTVQVGSLGIPINALYVGAQIVIDVGANQEIVTVLSVDETTNSFTANFLYSHIVGAMIVGATFSTQANSGDYFFSQSEILSYISRAQNEFLAQCPCVHNLNTQFVQIGQIFQQLICDAIETERIASSSMYITLVSLVRGGQSGYGEGGYGGGGYGAGSSAPNIVIATSQSPHNLKASQKFSIFNPPDPSFVGAFRVLQVIDQFTWAYVQDQPNATTYGGAAVLWVRLYETSQEELSIQDPRWRNNNVSALTSWYEDRTGNYRFGVSGKPASAFPIEVLVSTRDSDSLAMTDGLMVPDMFAHFVKYKSLEYCASKDGEQRNPLLAKYCAMRFNSGVMTARRWMDWADVEIGSETGKVQDAIH